MKKKNLLWNDADSIDWWAAIVKLRIFGRVMWSEGSDKFLLVEKEIGYFRSTWDGILSINSLESNQDLDTIYEV